MKHTTITNLDLKGEFISINMKLTQLYNKLDNPTEEIEKIFEEITKQVDKAQETANFNFDALETETGEIIDELRGELDEYKDKIDNALPRDGYLIPAHSIIEQQKIEAFIQELYPYTNDHNDYLWDVNLILNT